MDSYWEEFSTALPIARDAAGRRLGRKQIDGCDADDVAEYAADVFAKKSSSGVPGYQTPAVIVGIVRNYISSLLRKENRRSQLLDTFFESRVRHWKRGFDAIDSHLREDDACALAHYVRSNNLHARQWRLAQADFGWDAVRFEDAVRYMEMRAKCAARGYALKPVNSVFLPFDYDDWSKQYARKAASSFDSWQEVAAHRILEVELGVLQIRPIPHCGRPSAMVKWLNRALRLANSINHEPAIVDINNLRMICAVRSGDLKTFRLALRLGMRLLDTNERLVPGVRLADTLRGNLRHYLTLGLSASEAHQQLTPLRDLIMSSTDEAMKKRWLAVFE
ncbi:MAG: hypothetical protein AB7O68_16735 [Pirellulales bacterium]